MKRRFRALRATASSTRLIAAGGLAGVVAVYVAGTYPQYQIVTIVFVTIAIGSVIEFFYLEFESRYDDSVERTSSRLESDQEHSRERTIGKWVQIRRNWRTMDLDEFLRKYVPILEFIFIFILVLSDLAFPYDIILTWELVALIGLLVAIPYLPLIKKFSYRGVTVDLSGKVEEAERDVEENIPVPEGIRTSEYLPEEIPKQLYQLFDITHIAALAMLRIEIEDVLKEIADANDTQSFGYILNSLQNQEKLTRRTIHAIEEVRYLANQAIHEKDVRESEAEEILEIGIEALERLYYYKEEGKPMSIE